MDKLFYMPQSSRIPGEIVEFRYDITHKKKTVVVFSQRSYVFNNSHVYRLWTVIVKMKKILVFAIQIRNTNVSVCATIN
jgi:hypothetical protein